MEKLSYIIELIWKERSSDVKEINNYIDSLSEEQIDLFLRLSNSLMKDKFFFLYDKQKKSYRKNDIKPQEVNERFNKIKELLICFMLSEYRSTSLLNTSPKEKDSILNLLAQNWNVDKKLLVSSILHWDDIKKELY